MTLQKWIKEVNEDYKQKTWIEPTFKLNYRR